MALVPGGGEFGVRGIDPGRAIAGEGESDAVASGCRRPSGIERANGVDMSQAIRNPPGRVASTWRSVSQSAGMSRPRWR